MSLAHKYKKLLTMCGSFIVGSFYCCEPLYANSNATGVDANSGRHSATFNFSLQAIGAELDGAEVSIAVDSQEHHRGEVDNLRNFNITPFAQGGSAPDEQVGELDKANQQIANPLASATLFIQEFNTVLLDGDLAENTEYTGIYALDPLIPVPLTSDWNVVLRPIVPIAFGADVPVVGGTGGPTGSGGVSFESETGLGDISFFTLFNKNTSSPFKFGAGPAVRFPTATNDTLGSEKWSLGFAAVGLYSSPRFSAGILNQNYFSVAGADDRDDVSTSTFQYFAFYNFTPEWGIGTAPTISVDWNADDDQVLFPLGLGIAHTFKIGNAPSRLLLEAQHYVIQRDSFGPEWNFRVALAVFLPPLLSEPLFE